ncbi:hypothetical protein D3C87_1461780 [compost metagenome]
MSPFIGDRYCTFTLMLAGGRVTADADLDQLPVVMDKGDIGHTLFIVSVHQLIEHRSAGLVDLREKTHVSGFGRQSFDEGIFTVAILFRQRSNQHVTPVLECFDPVLAVNRSVGGCCPIIVVFDGKHGVFPPARFERLARGKGTAFESFLHRCRCLDLIWIRLRCRRH